MRAVPRKSTRKKGKGKGEGGGEERGRKKKREKDKQKREKKKERRRHNKGEKEKRRENQAPGGVPLHGPCFFYFPKWKPLFQGKPFQGQNPLQGGVGVIRHPPEG